MSHLTTYNSEVLVNCKKSLLSKAAKDLGLGIDFEIKEIKNSYITEKVDAGFLKDERPISVGLVFKKEKNKTITEVTGDFFRTGLDQRSFIDRLSQAYKKHDVIAQCKKQGWTINKEDISIDTESNEVVIRASRYVV